MKNSKNKGNEFERTISKKISMWWSSGLRDDLFWRTQGSGGRYTQRIKFNIKTHNQEGDITNTHPLGMEFADNFVVECKHYKDINLWGIITDSKNKLIEWWDKLNELTKKENKTPWLIVKENNKPILLITNNYLFLYRFCKKNNCKPKATFIYNGTTIYIYLFEDILKTEVKHDCYKD
jgi:hypothetical protein